MVTMDADDTRLHVPSQATLVWWLADTWCRVCIHQWPRSTKCPAFTVRWHL